MAVHRTVGLGHGLPDATVQAARVLLLAPVQGPVGAPFRPGDRFRWTSGNGLTVRTGTILEWQPYVAGSTLAARSWGSWFVEVEPLQKPRGARAGKHNPWDGFRTWFTGNEMGLVERVVLDKVEEPPEECPRCGGRIASDGVCADDECGADDESEP